MNQDLYDEKELFTLIAEGDELAFKRLFHLYLSRILRVVNAMVQSEAAAKDIVQDVFMSIWLSRDKLTQIEVPRNWIFRIVYHQTYNWMRKQGIRIKAKQRLTQEGTAEPFLHPTEEYIDLLETKKLLRQAISNLPPQTQKIYRLSREENLKINDIAEQLGLSPQTVKNTLGRALQSIRSYLEKHGIYLPLFLLAFLSA